MTHDGRARCRASVSPKKTRVLYSAGRGVALAWALLVGAAFIRSNRQAEATSRSGKTYEGFELFVRIYFKPLPEVMPGALKDTPEMIELGRRLFAEREISLTGSEACNDCHRLDGGHAGADDRPTSRGATGVRGRRNAPTVLNAGFQVALFWDGRAADLIEQAKAPLLDPLEMAARSEEAVLSRLKGMEFYGTAFERAFPGRAEAVTFDHVARALAAFERTLETPARFDRYLRGDKRAFTQAEEAGLHRFVDTGCVECHNSYPVGGRLLRKLGIYHPYKNTSDPGRYGVTGREEDRFVFKVCMLRNVTLTAPYFHDGGVSTLEEAVRLMAWMQLNKTLEPGRVDEILGFLRTLEAARPARLPKLENGQLAFPKPSHAEEDPLLCRDNR